MLSPEPDYVTEFKLLFFGGGFVRKVEGSTILLNAEAIEGVYRGDLIQSTHPVWVNLWNRFSTARDWSFNMAHAVANAKELIQYLPYIGIYAKKEIVEKEVEENAQEFIKLGGKIYYLTQDLQDRESIEYGELFKDRKGDCLYALKYSQKLSDAEFSQTNSLQNIGLQEVEKAKAEMLERARRGR